MLSVLAASAERRGERLKGRNGVAEGGRGARSRPTMPQDSAAIRTTTTASTAGLGPASPPDAESSANGKVTEEEGIALKEVKLPLLTTVPEYS